MASLLLEGTAIACRPGETVLEALLRHGIETAYSCKKGICHVCLTRASQGRLPPRAQEGLRETLRAQVYFLPCVCQPEDDLTIVHPEAEDLFIPAQVTRIERFSPKLMRLRLKPERGFDYRPGQFVNLRREDGLVRSYSLASVPGLDTELELHIQRSPNGAMSTWLHDRLRVGDRLGIEGPNGQSFYLPSLPEQRLLLIGTGSGLAPLYGILRDALSQGHRGRIELYHGTREPAGHYLSLELRELAVRFDNVAYIPCLSGAQRIDGIPQGRADEIALRVHPDLTGWRVFLAGHAEMVHKTKKAAYLAGAKLADIHADPFEKKDLRKRSRVEPLAIA